MEALLARKMRVPGFTLPTPVVTFAEALQLIESLPTHVRQTFQRVQAAGQGLHGGLSENQLARLARAGLGISEATPVEAPSEPDGDTASVPACEDVTPLKRKRDELDAIREWVVMERERAMIDVTVEREKAAIERERMAIYRERAMLDLDLERARLELERERFAFEREKAAAAHERAV